MGPCSEQAWADRRDHRADRAEPPRGPAWLAGDCLDNSGRESSAIAVPDSVDCSFNHKRMRGQRLGDSVLDQGISCGELVHLARQVAASVSSWREEIRMDDDLACTLLNQLDKTFGDVWVFDLQECCFDKAKPAALTDATCGLAHVIISFRPTASMPDN